MSYYEAIDTTKLTDARTVLICARLNLRGARRLFQRGKFTSGIAALYDSILFGMHYYIAGHADCTGADLGDAGGFFQSLAGAGVFEDQHAFNRLSLMVERALWQDSIAFDSQLLLVEVEEMLRRLGVMNRKPRSEVSH